MSRPTARAEQSRKVANACPNRFANEESSSEYAIPRMSYALKQCNAHSVMNRADPSSFYQLWLKNLERIQSSIIDKIPPMIAPIEWNIKNPIPMNRIGIIIIKGRTLFHVMIPDGFSTYGLPGISSLWRYCLNYNFDLCTLWKISCLKCGSSRRDFHTFQPISIHLIHFCKVIDIIE